MASKFPTEIDSIPLFLDVTKNDGNLIKQFEQYMAVNDFANANNILTQIENADQKIISADRLNKLRDCIIALELFYGENINGYITNKQSQWQGIIDQFKFVGIYSSSTQYKINNIVLFQTNGDYYLYIRTNGDGLANKPPTDTNYWRVLTVKGERGITQSGETTFYFDWVLNQTYAINSIVSHNNKWWASLKENINSEPMEGNSNWQLVMVAMQTLYPVQEDQPLAQQVGELWFEVI